MTTLARGEIAERMYNTNPRASMAYENAVRAVYGPVYRNWSQSAAICLVELLDIYNVTYPDREQLEECRAYHNFATHGVMERHLWTIEAHLWRRFCRRGTT